jgi:hypothetical protein
MRWTIDRAGQATGAENDPGGTTLDNGALHRCMADSIASWRFQVPHGGGVVHVSYPWSFKP